VNSPGLEVGPCGERFARAAFSGLGRTFLKFRCRRVSCVERWGRAWVLARKRRMERGAEDFIFVFLLRMGRIGIDGCGKGTAGLEKPRF